MGIINSFPGYEMVMDVGDDGKRHIKNMYRGIDLGLGGYVYSEYGVYNNVALLDVASMHPTSLIHLNYFGNYTDIFREMLEARIAIKHHDYNRVTNLMNGRLKKYLSDDESADQLAQALKIALNSQYGLTSSRYDLPQRDPRNVNNIVALRGALFIKTLQDEIISQGYSVIHCKTDSIKIPNATPEIIQFCMEFAQDYGYTFEHEATFEKMCLITDADYIAKYSWSPKKNKIGTWTATGAQFSHPFVFKTLFSREKVEFKDLCETKTVTTSLYLDMNESLPEGEHEYRFVGRAGQFCPIKPGRGGGDLLAKRGDKYNAVAGSKGYRWLESDVVRSFERYDDIDLDYFLNMSDKMFAKIGEYTDAELFCSNNPVASDEGSVDDGPMLMECGEINCDDCTHLKEDRYHSDCKKKYDNTNHILESGEFKLYG